MPDFSALITLVRYKAWADEILYRAISKLPEEELRKERPMLFGNILSLLNHVYSMDVVWQSHLEDKRHDLQTRNPQPPPPFSILHENQTTVNKWYEACAKKMSADESQEMISFTFIGGRGGRMTRLEMIQHVVNHSTYHRGHIGGVFYQMNIEPPTTDFPVYLTELHER